MIFCMKIKFIFLFLNIFFLSFHALAEERIKYSEVITEIPTTSMLGLKKSFSKEAVPWWAGIITSTLILVNNDEVILRDIQKQGRDLGLGNEDKTRAVISVGEIDLLRLPTDTGSFLYFLGDGWMNFAIAGGFLYNGIENNNTRAFNTSLRIAHGMATSTIFNQLLKRSFGRESPYVRTEYGGKWRPFPSVATYQEKTAQYDAMPSGHVMTSTLVWVIMNDSYPEYSDYLVPAGTIWVSLLGWQMVNNGVHWAADYPLGIGMGYVFAKASMQLGQTQQKQELSTDQKNSFFQWMITPYQDYEKQGLTLMATY